MKLKPRIYPIVIFEAIIYVELKNSIESAVALINERVVIRGVD